MAAIAASIKASGEQTRVNHIKLLESDTHVISMKRMARMWISTIFKKWDLLVTLEGKYVCNSFIYKINKKLKI